MIMPFTSATGTTNKGTRPIETYAEGLPASVVLDDAPKGWSWGWYPDPEPRFQLVPLGMDHRNLGVVRLEDRFGRRVFDPQGQFPVDVLTKLKRLVTRNRKAIETAWCEHAARQGWLQPSIDPGGRHLRLIVYAGTPVERTRWLRVNWPLLLRGRDPEAEDVAIDAELGDLVVAAREANPVRVPIRLLVLIGRTAVFEGLAIAEPDPASMQ